MVQYDIDDPLWTMQGEADSDAKLKDIYAKMEAPDQYVGKFYPGRISLTWRCRRTHSTGSPDGCNKGNNSLAIVDVDG